MLKKVYLYSGFAGFTLLLLSSCSTQKNKMLNSGAEYCSMTGSGSSIYALHKQKPTKSIKDSIFLEL